MKRVSYPYIHFKYIDDNEWHLYNTEYGHKLGEVHYYPDWDQYVFTTTVLDKVFNNTGLKDISHFLTRLNDAGGVI